MNMKFNMDQFFNWLTKPMLPEEIDAWYRANNIIPEMCELFRDYCFSLLNLINDTYLGDEDYDSKETSIQFTEQDKLTHFTWCWNKTIDNFKKENIIFLYNNDTFEYFKTFFMEVYYNQDQKLIRESLSDFFNSIFTKTDKRTKSDLDMFTELYKQLEKSLQI